MEAPGVERAAIDGATVHSAEVDGETRSNVVPLRPVRPRDSVSVSTSVTRVTAASVRETIERLRAMGFRDAADALEREQR